MLSRRESDIQVSCSRRVASSWKKSWCCQPLEAEGHGLQGCCSFRVHEDKVLMHTGNAIEYETVWDIGLCDEIITISLVSMFYSYLNICDCHCRGCGLRWCKCLPWLWWNLVLVAAASPSYRVSPEFDPQHVAYHQTFFPELRITANLFGGPHTLRIIGERRWIHGRHWSPAPWRFFRPGAREKNDTMPYRASFKLRSGPCSANHLPPVSTYQKSKCWVGFAWRVQCLSTIFNIS